MASLVTLRLVEEGDLRLLGRLFVDPIATGEFEWFGHRADRLREIERRWQQDGLIGEESFLAVTLDDGTLHWVGQLAPRSLRGYRDWHRPVARAPR